MTDSNLNIMTKDQLVVFFDGDCIVCDLEMSLYKKQALEGKIKFVDINSSEFQEYSQNISFNEAYKAMATFKNGKKVVGVDSFLLIWEHLPGKKYEVLASVFKNKIIYKLAKIGYFCFAKIRPFLPKKHWFSKKT